MTDAAGGPSRLYPRYEVEIWVDFTTLDLEASSYVLNLSEGGVFIKSDRPLPLDAEVDLVLTLPTGAPIRAKGRVAWATSRRKRPRTAAGAPASGSWIYARRGPGAAPRLRRLAGVHRHPRRRRLVARRTRLV